MAAKLHIKLVTPERLLLEKEADQVTLMTEQGEITILPGHIPLVANLRAGEVRVVEGGRTEYLVTSTGFVEVRENGTVTLLADTAEREEELDIQKIGEARTRAQETLSGVRKLEDVDYAHAVAALERELARERVAMKRKHRK
ncbi:ATP synthase F1 subunit epsilon [Candidatus Uhrbacteria bacterium]|nr:ATP synthase F1 subunit epsilon [Candidatus Uhrbacteria bacterium]